MAKLSTFILACAFAVTATVASPGFAPERRDLDGSLNAARANRNILGDLSPMVSNREDLDKYHVAGDQAISAFLEGRINNYYSYVGDAAGIVDKYIASWQVPGFVEVLKPALAFPAEVHSGLRSVYSSYLPRLKNAADKQDFGSAIQVVSDLASFKANYAVSANGVNVYSALGAMIGLTNNRETDDDVQAPSSPTSPLPTASSSASASKTSSTSVTFDSSKSSSSSTSSDSRSNDAGSSGVASLGMLSLGITISAIAVFF